jgi:hypothetical protein
MQRWDFFFAETLIVIAGLYLIHFSPEYGFIEWIMILLYLIVIFVLQIALPGELYVQAGLIGSIVIILVVYWFIFGIPNYEWFSLAMGTIFLSLSAILFTYQVCYPEGYWAIHSLWHVLGALGITFIFYTKEPAKLYQNAANKIYFR